MSSFKKFQELKSVPHHSNCNISNYLPKSFKPDEAYIVAWYGRIVSTDNGIKVRVFFVKNNQEFCTCALNKAETRSVEAYSYLRVTPFHDQSVHLSCNYIEINEQILP